jgi:ATP-dependent protease ClpP protease subunit
MEQNPNTHQLIGEQKAQTLADPSLVNYYNDIENRTYWLNDEINHFTFDLVQYILRWNKEDKGIPTEERKPIRIIVDCHGGMLSVTKTIVNIIKMSKTPVHMFALGFVASGASMIYLAGHKRYALPNTTFLLHKGNCGGLSGTFDELLAFMEDYQKDVAELIDFYKENTKFSPEDIENKIQGEWYIRIDEALENGIVDEIVTDIDLFC